MSDLVLHPQTTALILIDLQHAIVGRQTAPYAAADVIKNCAKLAGVLRAKGGMIVYVNVDLGNMLKLPVDKPRAAPNPLPPNACDIVPEAGMQPSDTRITKRQWGAFFGTDLEQQLRARHIETVVIGGIATNYGVESTARAAAGLGFALIAAEDACTSLDADGHEFAFKNIFPMLGRVRAVADILKALE